ncbi:MAG: hypothetical protein ABI183_00640 [Polyangiaceae bacterium]
MIGACSATKPDTGSDAILQVSGAQFFRGPMPSTESGPAVASLLLATTEVYPGEIDKPCTGALSADGTSVALSLDDDDTGYWILPAGPPDVASPDSPSFQATLAFSQYLTSGSHNLVARAVNLQNQFGPPTLQPLVTTNAGIPSGHLVVTLSWDTESDLDLHVIDPTGIEIWRGRINSYVPPPPGTPSDKNAALEGGILDFDSNAQCVIDGRRREDVVWKSSAPSGHYVVRVDTYSLCDADSANWRVEALLDGKSLGVAEGASFATATQLPHDLGAGVTALQFDLP